MAYKVLIITHSQEDNNCVETVTKALEDQGAQVFHLLVDKYPLSFQLSSTYTNGKWQVLLKDNETEYNLTDFNGIWNRRFHNFGLCLKDVIEEKYLIHCVNESKRTFFGLLRHLEKDVFFINDYSNLEIAECKELQLRVASDLGIQIPNTCITNNPKIAKAFLDECKDGAISKMQHNFRVNENGQESTLFTNSVSKVDIEQLDSLTYCPMQFQEKIAKKLELRIIIVGQKTYAFAIDSQAHEEGKTDWRKVGAKTLDQWYEVEIPDSLAEKLIQFMVHFGLNYGAADFILTPDDEYVFLEVNPAGEFFWIDAMLNHEISEHLAKLLTGQITPNSTSLRCTESIKNFSL